LTDYIRPLYVLKFKKYLKIYNYYITLFNIYATILYFRYKGICEPVQVQKCEDVPKIVKEEIHKRVPTQITGKIAFRVCPGKSDHEYTPTEVRTTDFTGY